MANFPVKRFQQNHVIFNEGAIGYSAYILQGGRIEISINTEKAKKIITILKPVSIFGEMALLLKDHKRSATATALDDCEVVEIVKKEFDDFVGSSPKIITTILYTLVERLQKTTTLIPNTANLFIATVEILNLLSLHKNQEILYEPILNSLMNIFAEDKLRVQEKFMIIETFNLIEIKNNSQGEKIIRLLEKDNFLQKAVKMNQILNGYAERKVT